MKGMFPINSISEFNRMIEEIESWNEQYYADAKRFLTNFGNYLIKGDEVALDFEEKMKVKL